MSAPTLVWRPSAAATSYDLELVRDGSVIHSQRLRSPRVVLPRRWQRAGVTYSIRPEDETFVWPVVGGRRSTVPLVNGVLALDLTPVARYVARSRSNGQQP
jgi:hypothetical protein